MADDEMVAWLTRRLDEMERTAKAATGQSWEAVWIDHPTLGPGVAYVIADERDTIVDTEQQANPPVDADAEHIALHDPRAVLARVEAERALMAAHPARGVQGGPPYRWACSTCDHAPVNWEAYGDYPCRTLRLLAYGHRFDAPGYRPEWSPE